MKEYMSHIRKRGSNSAQRPIWGNWRNKEKALVATLKDSALYFVIYSKETSCGSN